RPATASSPSPRTPAPTRSWAPSRSPCTPSTSSSRPTPCTRPSPWAATCAGHAARPRPGWSRRTTSPSGSPPSSPTWASTRRRSGSGSGLQDLLEDGDPFPPPGLELVGGGGVGDALVDQGDLALGLAAGGEGDHEAGRAGAPVGPDRLAGAGGADLEGGSGERALAQGGVGEGLVEALDRHGHCLGGVRLVQAAAALAGVAQAAGLLVADGHALGPPAADAVLLDQPAGDLGVGPLGAAPRVEQSEPLVPGPAGVGPDHLVRVRPPGPGGVGNRRGGAGLGLGLGAGLGQQLAAGGGVALGGLVHARADAVLEGLLPGHLVLLCRRAGAGPTLPPRPREEGTRPASRELEVPFTSAGRRREHRNEGRARGGAGPRKPDGPDNRPPP